MTRLRLTMIGSDAGLLPAPLTLHRLLLHGEAVVVQAR